MKRHPWKPRSGPSPGCRRRWGCAWAVVLLLAQGAHAEIVKPLPPSPPPVAVPATAPRPPTPAVAGEGQDTPPPDAAEAAPAAPVPAAEAPLSPANVQGNIRLPSPPPASLPSPTIDGEADLLMETPASALPAATSAEPVLPAGAQGNIRLPSPPAPVPVVPSSAPAAAETPAQSLARGMGAYLGRTGQPDYEQAARLFKAAADGGDARGSIAYAYLQMMGFGAQRNYTDARQRLQAASAGGLARADYLLSLLETLEKRAQYAQRASALREAAARRGDAVAENAMGVYYQLQGDRGTAELWYQRAVEHGSRTAAQNLSGLARSDAAKEQVAATTSAAGQGDAEALFALAQRYHRGEGVPLDYAKALKLYRAAAAKGHEAARQMLGLIQSRTGPDGQIDPAWMQQLASTPVGGAGRKSEPALSAVTVPKNDDPLAGLLQLPGQDVPASPTRSTP